MKQLMDSCGRYIIVGCGSRTFTGSLDSDQVFELMPPSCLPSSSGGTATVDHGDTIAPQSQSTDVQAVAVLLQSITAREIWCAVARSDKSLSLYCVRDPSEDRVASHVKEPELISIRPHAVYKTPKRITSLCFATMSDEYNSSYDLSVVIAADLAGDATAFALTPKTPEESSEKLMEDHARYLLGHTASMLTCVRVVQDGTRQRIATSDRDEKIRVSSFPDTHVIEGFLLGHKAFVACVDVARDNGVTRCVSCSGDGTVRMWNYVSMEELGRHKISTNGRTPLPTQVAINSRADTVFVCLDEQDDVQVLRWKDEERRFVPQSAVKSISGVALAAVYMDSDDTFLILNQGQRNLQAVSIDDSDGLNKRCYPLLEAMQSLLVDGEFHLPTSILERDDHGVLKMQKQEENRVHDRPWNNASRKTIAKERDRRNKKRRRSRNDSVASAKSNSDEDGYDGKVE